MGYLKISFTVTTDEEWFSDLLISQLAGSGFDSFAETASGFEAYITEDAYAKINLKEIPLLCDNRFPVSFSKEKNEEMNWNEEWERNCFSPVILGGRYLVRTPMHTGRTGAEAEIVIEPNMTFGTGDHETTALMAELLINEELKGKTVLDMGCGTGILAILASKRGAESVTAIDNDERARQTSERNASLNNAPNIRCLRGDAGLLTSDTYDLILANIFRNVIVDSLPSYAMALRSGGRLLLSGFFTCDLSGISLIAEKNGLRFLGSQERNNWVAARYTKP